MMTVNQLIAAGMMLMLLIITCRVMFFSTEGQRYRLCMSALALLLAASSGAWLIELAGAHRQHVSLPQLGVLMAVGILLLLSNGNVSGAFDRRRQERYLDDKLMGKRRHTK